MELHGKFVVAEVKKSTQAEFFKDLRVGDSFELRYPLSGAYKRAPYIYIYQHGERKHLNTASQLGQNLRNFELKELIVC